MATSGFNLNNNIAKDRSKSMTYFPLPNSIYPKFTLRGKEKGVPERGGIPGEEA